MDRISWKEWWNRKTEIPKWKKKEASILFFADAKCEALDCDDPINYSNPIRAFPWGLDKDDLWKDPIEYETVELGCLCKHHVEEEISICELLGNRECEIETDWYPNGGLCKEIKYIGGKKNGVEVSWHENGQKAKEITYVEGRMVGKSTSWYPNGIKAKRAITENILLVVAKNGGMTASGPSGMKTELNNGKNHLKRKMERAIQALELL